MLKSKDENLKKLTDGLISYLNCPCRYFPPSADDGDIMNAYREARERGEKNGFIPMITVVDDILFECLVMNANDHGSGDMFDFSAEAVKNYRDKMLSEKLPNGKEFFDKLSEEMEEYEEEYPEVGEINGSEVNDRFSGYWDYNTNKTCPLILAEIPVQNPWEVFAYLPFGGWNACPDTEEQMAAAKYWYELYGAVPAVLTHDVLEFELPKPAGTEKALELAKEQYLFCADIVDQGVETVGALADMLSKSKVWYFWWD